MSTNHDHEEFPTDQPAVVTCGLPYANGALHIGHLRTYVSGDIYSRALKRLGQETAFVSGSDMHGTPIAVNAEQEGVPPEEFALRHYEEHKEIFPRFDIEFDNYGHTHDETNAELTTEFVRTLDEKGHIYEKEIKIAYDPIEEQSLPDRYVEGRCPYCGERARGDECDEGCGRHLEPGEIEDPESTVTGNPAEYRDQTHKFFRVSEFQAYLSEFLDRLEGTENARNQPREWIDGDLQDWCITRDLDWGIEYPDEETDLVLYVWVDAPIEYVASTKQYTERVGRDEYDWENVWQEEGEVVHIIGRDIIQHHTVFWPAMLRGVGYNEPRAVMASGFMTLAGSGFSKSRNRAVWAEEYLDEGFAPDLLRHYLATHGGFQQDIDFSWSKFQESVNADLVGTVGNFLYRSLLFAARNYGGTPDVDGAISSEVAQEIEVAIEAFTAGVNDYSIRQVGNSVVTLARFGNEYIQRNEPWSLTDDDPERAEQVIRDCVQIAKAIGVLMEPVAPATADRLWSQLNEDGSVHDASLEAALSAPSARFEEPTELFEKIENNQVEALNERLEQQIQEAKAEETETNDAQTKSEMDDKSALNPLAEDRISFEEFQGLDLRVGRIESAEPIEGADELLKLTVDIGVETRQIVAGLKQLHDVDSLPGTRVIVIANLEKADLFGTESNGMVLAAGDDADLLTTLGNAPLGSKVM